MWFREKFFKYALGIIMVLVIIYLFGKIEFFLVPFKKFVAILFLPILISLLFYYLLRPLVSLVEKLRIPRVLAITIIFLVAILVIAMMVAYSGSLISSQLNQLISDLPTIWQNVIEKTNQMIRETHLESYYTDKVQQQLTTALERLIPFLSKSIFDVFSAVTGFTTVLVVVPFIIFYFLKDDRIFFARLVDGIPDKYRSDVKKVLKDIDKTLSTYIIGQATVALLLGVLMYIGYLFIGMNYALILSLFAIITFFIPLFGSVIGVLPAILISLADSPYMPIKIIILMVIVQQLEGNLISPQLMGKRLDIHPLTLILLFLVAASLYGFLGMLIAVPTYAVVKVVFVNLRRIYTLWKSKEACQQQ